VNEKETIPLIYAVLRGMKAYKEACEEMEKYFDSKEGKINPELEKLIKTYEKLQKLILLFENFLD
jgi:hypothetical protein